MTELSVKGNRRIRSIFPVLALPIFCAQICLAQSTGVDDDSWKDWQVTIAPSLLRHYLDYPGSSITGITRVEIGCAQPDNTPPKRYEELWYTQSKALGCRRWQQLSLTPGTAGVIRIVHANADQSGAVVNAALRVWLDLYLSKCMTKRIVVPRASFDNIVAAFRQRGFIPDSDLLEGRLISLEIASDDDQVSETLVSL